VDPTVPAALTGTAVAARPRLGRAAWLGVVWSNVAFVCTRALSFVAVVILAHLLAPSEFGVVAAVLVILGVLELGSDLGMRASVIYEQEFGITQRVQTAFTFGLIVAGVITAFGLVIAPLVGDAFDINGVTGLFRLAVLNVMLTGFGNVHDALLLREMDMKRRTVSEVVRGVARAGVSIALALAGVGAASLVWGMLAGTAVWVVTLWGLTGFIPSLSFDRRAARSMAAYGLGASALDALAAVTTRLDVVVIGRVLGSGALGLYTIAFRLPEVLIQSVAWNISQVMFPALSRQRVLDRERLEPVTLMLIRYQALYALPVAAVLAVLAPPLVEVLFGPRWHNAAGVLAAIAVLTSVAALIHPLGDLLKAVGKQRILVAINLAVIPVAVVAMVMAASAGIVAVAWARVGSGLLFAIGLALFTPRSLGIRPLAVLGAALPGVAAGIGTALGAAAVRVAWPGPTLAVVATGAIAGCLTGIVLLRLLYPGTFHITVDEARAMARERRSQR
jgi:lipopolysaccharide exporter